jgi:hypothetical protein
MNTGLAHTKDDTDTVMLRLFISALGAIHLKTALVDNLVFSRCVARCYVLWANQLMILSATSQSHWYFLWPLQACDCTLWCLEFKWRVGNDVPCFCLSWDKLHQMQMRSWICKSPHYCTDPGSCTFSQNNVPPNLQRPLAKVIPVFLGPTPRHSSRQGFINKEQIAWWLRPPTSGNSS